ncbi:MAG: L-idonate 5-dehydrogenase [Rhodobacteraceae bacterium]|nr:L-idonate 5-dehydrogenase [Paracoccaceae bacterium]MCY4195678.1 L-idonate 5-dehydrogenase [Paracoccaceae bacterium]MCY4326402.1 L-idonate 5-dehydrogenase [Paracoccaceae bacterium]
MKSRVCRLHGQNDLRIETVDVIQPGPGQVLVAVHAGGICGSDLHYVNEGGIGAVRVREPIILGHEVSGQVLAVGKGVEGLTMGTKVAINPSRPCGACSFCAKKLKMHCLNMRFNGSAARLPHDQGLFRDKAVIDATQCLPLPENANMVAAACSEPLAVCLHAMKISGGVRGKRILITGAGAIGSLCVAAAAAAGAAEIVITDLHDEPLATAMKMGASRAINICRDAVEMDVYAKDKGYFHLAFECSAAASAIRSAIAMLRPRGVLIQVGVAGETPVPINALVAKEIRVQGSYRFHDEFAEAVGAIISGRIDVSPIMSLRCPLEDANAAFNAAADRTRTVRVHLTFEAGSV